MGSYAIITGKYPPQKGGVADYTEIVARELALTGAEVQVWAPLPPEFSVPNSRYPIVNRVDGIFNLMDIMVLDRALSISKPDRILVQYVPHAFGCRAMNVPFCAWLMLSRHRYPIWVMFHEVAFPIRRSQRVRHNFLGIVNKIMAGLLARSAQRIFVSTPSWSPILKAIAPAAVRPEWLPVPSNVPLCCSQAGHISVRERYASPNAVLVGHFGTYGPAVSKMLAEVVPQLLATNESVSVMLLGDRGRQFSDEFLRMNPTLKTRVHAVGFLQKQELSHHITACDVLLQPYPDGISSRRTTAMAALAHGKAVVTTSGVLTESIWEQSKAVALAPSNDLNALSRLVAVVSGDLNKRRRLSRAGYQLYRDHFDIKHTIAAIRESN